MREFCQDFDHLQCEMGSLNPSTCSAQTFLLPIGNLGTEARPRSILAWETWTQWKASVLTAAQKNVGGLLKKHVLQCIESQSRYRAEQHTTRPSPPPPHFLCLFVYYKTVTVARTNGRAAPAIEPSHAWLCIIWSDTDYRQFVIPIQQRVAL